MAMVQAGTTVQRLNTQAASVTAVLKNVATLAEISADDREERARLETELAEAVADSRALKRAIGSVGAGGGRASLALGHVVRRFASDPAWRDHPIVHEVLEETIRLNELLVLDPEAEDPEWKIRETVGQINDLVGLLRAELAHNTLDEPSAAAHYVATELGTVDQNEVAELLDVDPRTLRNWKAVAPASVRKNPERVVLVAQLVYELRRGFTPPGVVRWFKRPRTQLSRKTPLQLIDRDPLKADEPLRDLARGGRAQLGT